MSVKNWLAQNAWQSPRHSFRPILIQAVLAIVAGGGALEN